MGESSRAGGNGMYDPVPREMAGDTEAAGKAAVDAIGRALVAAPSLGPITKAWTKLGFDLSRPFEFLGCTAVDLLLEGSGVRFLAPGGKSNSPLASLVAARLVEGAGLLGWTWFCTRMPRSAQSIVTRSGRPLLTDEHGRTSVVVDPQLSPGAATLIEPLVKDWALPHPNQIAYLDRLVLACADADRTARAYSTHFGLQMVRHTGGPHGSTVMAIHTARETALEIIATSERGPDTPADRLWGLTFESSDLNATIACLRARSIAFSEPRKAADRGRGITLPTQIGGIQIAIFGR
jgi:catechol 2,3-dioxygenase-like lactoylglutathione lyase family enzyme